MQWDMSAKRILLLPSVNSEHQAAVDATKSAQREEADAFFARAAERGAFR